MMKKYFVNTLSFLRESSFLLMAFTLPNPIMVLTSVMLGIFLGSSLLLSLVKEVKIFLTKKDLVFVPFVILFLLTLISVFYVEDTALAYRKIEVKLGLLLLPLAIMFRGKLNSENVKLFKSYFLSGVFVSSIVALCGAFYLNWNNYGDYFYYNQFSQLLNIHTTYYGVMLVIALLLMVERFSENKLISGLSIIYFYFLIYLISSRGVFLASAVIPSLYSFTRVSEKLSDVQKRKVLFFVFIGGTFGVLGLVYLPHFSQRWNTASQVIHNHNELGSFGARFSILKAAFITYLEGDKLIGYGGGDYLEILHGNYLKIGVIDGFKNRFNAHNQFLEQLMASGVVGFCVLIWAWAASTLRAFTSKNFLLVNILVLICFVSCFESILERYHGVMLLSFLLLLNEDSKT